MNTEAVATVETTETVGHFINGRMVADNARTQDVFNPATGRAVRQVALAGKATANHQDIRVDYLHGLMIRPGGRVVCG